MSESVTLSIIIPCFNEENTLESCVERVLKIKDHALSLEVIIIDDASRDKSWEIINSLMSRHPEIIAFRHRENKGKGAALRTGFQKATGNFIAVQDADLEYNPDDLKRLLVPLINDEADVVFGSRFLSDGAHRVLYFWHSLGNRFLTFVSNMFSDLNLTDMETCYKVFRREIIQGIQIEENRFGFEPEIVAKVAQLRPRVYEMGISYHGRTYEEGKKIGVRDGIRALYCIFHYNMPKAPAPIQFIAYLLIGGAASLANILFFLVLLAAGVSITVSAGIAFILAAVLNYALCITLLFRHKSRWNTKLELLMYSIIVCVGGGIDISSTNMLFKYGLSAALSKVIASALVLVFNFIGRKYLVFPEKPSGPWKPSFKESRACSTEVSDTASCPSDEHVKSNVELM